MESEQDRPAEFEQEIERHLSLLDDLRNTYVASLQGAGAGGRAKRLIKRALALFTGRQERMNTDVLNVAVNLAELLRNVVVGPGNSLHGLRLNVSSLEAWLHALTEDVRVLRQDFISYGKDVGGHLDRIWKSIEAVEERVKFIREETSVGLEYRDAVRAEDTEWMKRVFARYQKLWPKCGGEFEDKDQAARRDAVLSLTPPGAVLEVGCAEGAIIGKLDPENHLLVGLHISLDRLKAGEPPTQYVNGLAEALPFADKSFDTILLPEIVEHVPDPRKIIDEAIRVARERLVFTVPTDFYDPTHLWNFDDEMFQKLLNEFAVLEVDEKIAVGPFQIVRAALRRQT